MSKYEVIEQIMKSNKINENGKVYCISMFIKGWWIEEDLEWIWE